MLTAATTSTALAATIAEGRTLATLGETTTLGTTRRFRQHLATIDPHFDPDASVGGERLADRVIDVGTQRMQRHLAIVVLLGAGDFGATQAA